MQTIHVQPVRSNASAVQAVCWPEYVEESFDRLVAAMELVAELPSGGPDVPCVPTHAL